MKRLGWVQVSRAVPGQVLVAALDPATGTLALPRAVRVRPHVRLVAATIESVEPHPQPNDLAWDLTHRLRVSHNGRRYTAELRSLTHLTMLETHHPVCGKCGEVWPCRDVRLDQAADELIASLEQSCAHCDEPIGGAESETFHDGLTRRQYHTALRYRGPDGLRCRVALAAAKAALGVQR